MSLIIVGGGKKPKFELLRTFWSTTNASSYTASSVDLGRAVPSRLIIVTFAAKNTLFQYITSITVGGVDLTSAIFRQNTGNSVNGMVGVYYKTLASGESGDVVATFSGTMTDCMLGIYRAELLNSNSVYDTAPDSTGDGQNSMSLNIPKNGVAVGAVSYVTSPSSTSWTGLTEDRDELGSTAASSIASAGLLAEETGRTISVVAGSSPSRYCCASFG